MEAEALKADRQMNEQRIAEMRENENLKAKSMQQMIRGAKDEAVEIRMMEKERKRLAAR
jgi:hypothetical protein